VRNAIRGREHVPHESGERRRVDRPAADLEPFAVRDEVRLRGLAGSQPGRAERGTRQREDTALAVRPRDQRPADGELRIAERAKERPRPAQSQPNAIPAACREGLEGVVVGHGLRGCLSCASGRAGRRADRGRGPRGLRLKVRHSRVSSSS
jgi:hypothetical protein